MRLMEYLPERYQNSVEMVEFEEALNYCANLIIKYKEEVFKQLNVETATWGLQFWEDRYALEIDLSKPYDWRRSRIRSKMRGQGTTTVAMIKNVAMSFVYGKVEVIEHNEEYYFEVMFVSDIGIPPSIDDIKAAISDLKPAHLNVEYTFKFRVWKDARNYTWGYLSNKNTTWEQLKGGEMN